MNAPLQSPSNMCLRIKQPIVLASASPRRQSLLKQIVEDFECIAADIDESAYAHESAHALVARLAHQKAEKVLMQVPDALVIGSDTLISIGDEVLGKPTDKADFLNMMARLSDKTHSVLTAVACLSSAKQASVLIESEVIFAPISEAQALAYWHTNEPIDKAGGYAIQGLGAQFVKSIKGSYSAIVGLPLYETKQLIEGF